MYHSKNTSEVDELVRLCACVCVLHRYSSTCVGSGLLTYEEKFTGQDILMVQNAKQL